MTPSQQGFTLIEILVAIAILSIIAVGVSGMLISILRITGRTQSEQSFGYVAQHYMEGVRVSWNTCAVTGTPPACSSPATYPAYEAATLPALPSGLPSGVTCTAAASPSTVSNASTPIRSREVTLSCTGSGPSQVYSLVVTQP